MGSQCRALGSPRCVPVACAAAREPRILAHSGPIQQGYPALSNRVSAVGDPRRHGRYWPSHGGKRRGLRLRQGQCDWLLAEYPPIQPHPTYTLTRSQTDDLFSRLASVNISVLPHPMSISQLAHAAFAIGLLAGLEPRRAASHFQTCRCGPATLV
jgi:hypothetical protein